MTAAPRIPHRTPATYPAVTHPNARSKARNRMFFRPRAGLRMIALSAGLRVRATTPERMIDEAIVMPNWR